ncbi:TetR/AcrR family transcriptional regulator [Mycolicibacterium pulveris]|uniref:TetR family transcriptional regulator n=2 Tax=Mycolicibacterium pulveris TaxID=36813 RepID=A0A7I7UIG0_MYCPV|nr:TetR/AcrR family transcriptional regulator [Mycolicibacterium pulveris]BBY81152.1 TetR family transcriptional regulator [Mycolicibacterium pulveris]
MNYSARRRGRRVGKPDTRTKILDVARRRFLDGGYQAVTLRSVAADAGVDIALISYYFGAKRGLISEALALAANPADVIEGAAAEADPATFPQRVLSGLLALWEEPESGAPLRALISGAAHDEALASLVKEMVDREIVDKLATRIGGADARKRAGMFCAQIVGLIVSRYILKLEPACSMTHDEIVRQYAPPLHLSLRPRAGAR